MAVLLSAAAGASAHARRADHPTVRLARAWPAARRTPRCRCAWRTPTYKNPVSGSNAPPSQFAPPEPGNVNVPFSALGRIDEGRRREHRSNAIALDRLQRHRLQLRREVDEVGLGHPLSVEGRRLCRERLRRRRLLAWHIALRDGSLFDRPHGLAVGPVEHVRERMTSSTARRP